MKGTTLLALAAAVVLAAPTTAAAGPGDFVKVWAKHSRQNPKDPVEVSFGKFAVTKSSFNPKNLKGATATLEIDLTSLSSGIKKRDTHLQSADYLDTASFAKAVVSIGKVSKTKSGYQGEAVIKVRGKTKSVPVTLTVIKSSDTAVTVKGELTFDRTDFGVGKAKDDPVASKLKATAQLTLTKGAKKASR